YEGLVAALDEAETGDTGRREASMRRAGKVVVALVPAHLELDLDALARHCAASSAGLLETWPAERVTGSLPGGLSPIGLPPGLDVMVDHRVMDAATVVVNAGRRGLSMELRPSDLLSASGATLAPLAG
ncbi:MAG: YbaK/EbsC family protein, partial [Acidimicrobiales bacterium]